MGDLSVSLYGTYVTLGTSRKDLPISHAQRRELKYCDRSKKELSVTIKVWADNSRVTRAPTSVGSCGSEHHDGTLTLPYCSVFTQGREFSVTNKGRYI
jgi:hypothetical protein